MSVRGLADLRSRGCRLRRSTAYLSSIPSRHNRRNRQPTVTMNGSRYCTVCSIQSRVAVPTPFEWPSTPCGIALVTGSTNTVTTEDSMLARRIMAIANGALHGNNPVQAAVTVETRRPKAMPLDTISAQTATPKNMPPGSSNGEISL